MSYIINEARDLLRLPIADFFKLVSYGVIHFPSQVLFDQSDKFSYVDPSGKIVVGESETILTQKESLKIDSDLNVLLVEVV